MALFKLPVKSLLVTGLALGNGYSTLLQAQSEPAPVETPAAPRSDSAPPVPPTPPSPVAPAAKVEGEKKVERIEVTGSRIKRIDAEGKTPVTVIGRKEIENSGVTSVRDLLSSYSGTTSAFNGGGASVAGGVATISLKGFGANRTLVLVDGVRLPKHPELGAFDLNSLPVAAIERVEILNQSAASVYGSEAIGGVVNIITRKNFEGSSVQLYASQPLEKGGESRNVSGVVGINSDAFTSTLVVSYDQEDILYTKQRQFSENRTSPIGSPGTYTGTPAGGARGTFQAPGCPNYTEASAGVPAEIGRAGCSYNYNEFNTLQPAINRISGLYNFQYDMNNDMEVTGKVIATHQNSTSQLRHESTANQVATIGQPAIDAMDQTRFDQLFPGFGGTKPTTGGVLISSRLKDFGIPLTRKTSDLLGGVLGLGGKTSNEWEWKVNASAGRTKTRSESSNKLREAVWEDLITSGGYIPWDPARDLAGVKNALLTNARYTESTTNTGLEGTATTPIGSLGGGAINLALSTGVLGETYDVEFDEASRSLSLINVAGSGGDGDRTIGFAAFEVDMPVTKEFDVNVAGRFDQYSDFGGTFNPQLTFSYAPWTPLKFRGSVGTAFKAPTLDELHGAAGVSYNGVVDRPYCEANGITPDACEADIVTTAASVKNLRRGNDDLDPEKSRIYGFGVVVAPDDSTTISADYWKILSDDLIERRDLQDLVDENDPLVKRDPITGLITEIDYPIQNLNKSVRSGLDGNFTYLRNTGRFATMWRTLGTWYFEDKIEPEGKPQQNNLGKYASYKWRLSNEISADWDKTYGVTLASSSTGKHEKVGAENEYLPEYTRYDGQIRYTHPLNGDVSFGIINLFNKQGGKDDSNLGDVDADLYDINGREFYLRLTQNF